MPFITRAEMSAIWLDVEPEATQAFEQIASDHGKRFAEVFRDSILASRLVFLNELAAEAISAQRK